MVYVMAALAAVIRDSIGNVKQKNKRTILGGTLEKRLYYGQEQFT